MKAKKPPRGCPCGSSSPYAACCAPFHRGEREAPSCEALMRSRYAAFAVGDADYLWRTMDAAHPDRAVGETLTKAQLRSVFREQRFMGLSVLDHSDSQVLFIARVFEKGRDRSFIELSDFTHDGEGFRYASGAGRPLSEVRGAEGLRIATFAAA